MFAFVLKEAHLQGESARRCSRYVASSLSQIFKSHGTCTMLYICLWLRNVHTSHFLWFIVPSDNKLRITRLYLFSTKYRKWSEPEFSPMIVLLCVTYSVRNAGRGWSLTRVAFRIHLFTPPLLSVCLTAPQPQIRLSFLSTTPSVYFSAHVVCRWRLSNTILEHLCGRPRELCG